MPPRFPAAPESLNPTIPILNRAQVTACLKPRPCDSHKGDFGTVIVIGGAKGMVGAALLAARAALKLGAGRVHVGLLAEAIPAWDPLQPELMLHDAATALACVAHSPHPVIVAGCGMGTTPQAVKLLTRLVQMDVPLVLDADALNLISSHPEFGADIVLRTAATLLTPHPGEAARLLGVSTQAIQADRIGAARQLAARYRCFIALKGANSLTASPDGALLQNNTGNPGMSTAGMGDVLAGIIGALIAQGLAPNHAVPLGLHLHGAAGDALAQQDIHTGMTASELIDMARLIFNQWQSDSSCIR